MAHILRAISGATTNEIEAAGFRCRVRKVCSSDIAEVGVAGLHALRGAAKQGEGEASPEDIASSITPQQAKTLARHQEAVVCASLIAIGDAEGTEWDGVQVVMDAKREDPDKGILCVGSLPQGMVNAVFAEAMRLSTDDGRAADRLAAFRTSTRSAASD
jgi:hypothetical protein